MFLDVMNLGYCGLDFEYLRLMLRFSTIQYDVVEGEVDNI